MALLDRAFPGRVRLLGADLGWSAISTSLLFGLWHGLDVSLAWCRARGGSLLFPIVAHAGPVATSGQKGCIALTEPSEGHTRRRRKLAGKGICKMGDGCYSWRS